jgi:hypothetical protein
MDALERDLKREAMGLSPASEAKEKRDLMSTLELAKEQCKPLIDFEAFEPERMTELLPSSHEQLTPHLTSAATFTPLNASPAFQYRSPVMSHLLPRPPDTTATTSSMPSMPSVPTVPHSEQSNQNYMDLLTIFDQAPRMEVKQQQELSKINDKENFFKSHQEKQDLGSNEPETLENHSYTDSSSDHPTEKSHRCQYEHCGKHFLIYIFIKFYLFD